MADVDKDEYVQLTDEQKARFDGTTVKKDKDGYYCMTHRCRSKSYPSVDKIPKGRIEFIESTGCKIKMADLAIPLKVGDEIMVGRFKNKKQTVKGFGTDDKGQPTVKTESGEHSLLPFRIKKLMK